MFVPLDVQRSAWHAVAHVWNDSGLFWRTVVPGISESTADFLDHEDSMIGMADTITEWVSGALVPALQHFADGLAAAGAAAARFGLVIGEEIDPDDPAD